MTWAEIVLVMMWLGLTAYALLGGADFGGGFWDLIAGGAKRGAPQRALIEHSIGPVWEANHVWLIFVLVILWTGFPAVFAALASSLYVPLTAAGLGIILRGAGFAFRKVVEGIPLKRIFGATFALSSVMTPFFLGTIAGAVASGRVPPGNAAGDPVVSWLNPTSVLGGILAVGSCAYLAAVYLTADATRDEESILSEGFRARAIATAIVTGAVALGGIAVLRADAPDLYDGLTGRALPLVALSGAGGLASVLLVLRRSYVAARLAAGLAVASVLWGWGVAQYPDMLVGRITIAEAAASSASLKAVAISLGIGTALFVPGLVWLLVLFQRPKEA
ncbi:MAG: cytochrome d ubiquinol oxidase subunit II [Actinomycetota bacterium]|nr:cytochrome d ubiquinol oxidase subunit II [Actinomycetota bacterium]